MYACLVELPKNKSPQPLSAIDCLKEIGIHLEENTSRHLNMLDFSSSHVKSIGGQRKTCLVLFGFDLLGHTTPTDDLQ